jgi:adenosyl cobinamide kinase/adenosyl cobinamide phosphate guanylyltransferase
MFPIVFTTDGTDGQLQYISEANDFDVEGHWRVQAYIESGAQKWHTSEYTFVVEGNLDAVGDN